MHPHAAITRSSSPPALRRCLGLCAALLAGVAVADHAWGQVGRTRLSPAEQRARQQAEKRRQRTVAVLKKLETKVAAVQFDEAPFTEVIEWLNAQGLQNVVVSWKALDQTNALNRDTPITLLLRQVTLGNVLDLALAQASDEVVVAEDRLTYHIDGGVLRISTRRDFDRRVYTRTYYIEDLLQPVMINELLPFLQIGQQSAYVAELDPTVASGAAAQRPIIGIINSGTHHGPGGPEYGRPDFEDARNTELEKLIAVLKTIRPETWREGGGRGAINAFGQKLIITQTIEMHEIIGGAFEKTQALRRSGSAP